MNKSKRKHNLIHDGDALETLEIRLLLEGIFQRYGYDFRDYSFASIKRRIRKRIEAEGFSSVSRLQEKVLHDPEYMERLLLDISINVTDFFRDPEFYTVFREKVVPLLRTYPFVRIWHAGCSTGEEVYSMAILLLEEGLYEKSKIYATDMNEVVLKKAKAGIFPLKSMKGFTQNYLKACGKKSFSQYYTARYGHALFNPVLRKNIIFSVHNLATDSSFNEFNVILCRNVMIYFNRRLQERVHKLFYESLCLFGILGLGDKESIKFTPYEANYKILDARWKLYRKVK